MRGGLVGGLCFLAFLLSSGTKGQNVLNSQDLQGSTSQAQAVAEASFEQNRDDSNDKSIQDEIEPNDSSNVAYSVAHAESGNPGNSVRPNWAVPPWGSNVYTNTYTEGNAQASANAQASGNTGNNNPVYGYNHPSLNEANPGDSFPYGPSKFKSDTVQNESELNSDYHAVGEKLAEREEPDSNDTADDESRMGGGFSYYGAFTGAVSRVVPQNEIIQPDLMPGGLNLIHCTRENEIHTIWAPALQCLVCVCVRDGWALRSICVNCSSCATRPSPPPLPPLPPPPDPPIPFPSPTEPPIPFPPPLPPLIPESQVSCSPLPTNTPFENPLNPCQTCICQNIVNAFGQEDVLIKCEENPICVSPPGFIPIPPPPEPPTRQPMSLCESLPVNVQFPHPTENCMICRCVVEMTPYLIPERRMLCEPDVECGTIHEVIVPPPPLPPQPTTTEFPIIPYPVPPPPPIPPRDIDPVPWPPVMTPMPRLPSPLPGPPPHETCRPYPPNTPFQHPWDECQICICSEIHGTNVVNIEVNCYTKKSCCIEPPIPEPVPALPYLPVPSPGVIGNLIFIEPKCRYHAPNEPYVVDCDICVCETVFQYVYAKCNPQPNCGQLPQYYNQIGQIQPYGLIPGSNADASATAFAEASGTGSSSADAFSNAISGGFYNQGQASSSAIANAFANTGNQYPFIGGSPSSYSSADASANAQTSNINLYPFDNSYPYTTGQSSAQAQAEAFANAQSGNVNTYPYSNSYNSYPYSPSGQSSAQAQAEALANAQSSSMSPYGMYPYSSSGQSSALAESEAFSQSSSYGQSQSSAQAQAEALAQSGGLSLYGAPYGGAYGGLYSPGQSQSSAQAEALANAQILGNLGTSPYGINQPYPGGQSTAQAQAEALANAQSQTLGSPYGSYFGGSQASAQAQAESIAASQLYPSLYHYPTTNIGQLYQTGVNGWDSASQSQAMASAQAQAQAQADVLSQSSLFGGSSASAQSQAIAQSSSSATAQSLTQAAALSGRPLIKSGKGLCKYAGDQYHHNCQACYCLAEASGKIYTLCLGNPCA